MGWEDWTAARRRASRAHVFSRAATRPRASASGPPTGSVVAECGVGGSPLPYSGGSIMAECEGLDGG